jgi:hypothetical protein
VKGAGIYKLAKKWSVKGAGMCKFAQSGWHKGFKMGRVLP